MSFVDLGFHSDAVKICFQIAALQELAVGEQRYLLWNFLLTKNIISEQIIQWVPCSV